jgi:TRAP-type mannitol/chloroaromatic compound transport system permease small subunit
MAKVFAVCRSIDAVTAFIGRCVSWLILVAIFVGAGNAIARKLFNSGSNAWLELQWYLFGAAYMLAAAYTLQRNEHIRIDIASGALPRRARNWIDVMGHLFMLMPFVLLVIWHAIPAFLRSYRLNESSLNSDGLLVWPAKLIVVAGLLLLFLQGIAEILRRIAIMRGLIADPEAHGDGQPQLNAPGAEAG